MKSRKSGLRWLPIVYHRTRAKEESSSNLRALEQKCQSFSIFYDVNMSAKSKTDSAFPQVSFGEIS